MSAQTLNDLATKIDERHFFAKLREEQPVYFDPGYQMYVISRYADVMDVLKQPVLFSSARVYFNSYQHEDIVNRILNEEGHGPLKEVFPMTDPPEHTRIRSLSNLAFSARRISKIRSEVERLAGEMVDRLLGHETIEVFSELAQPLAVTVIGDLLCLPRERWKDVLRWTNAYATCAGNRLQSQEHAEQIARDLADVQNFVVGHLDERRKNPQDDILTDLLKARSSGLDPLDDKEILAISVGFIGAGHETTTVAITELIKTLTDNPDLAEALYSANDDGSAIRAFCEESLRMNAPVKALLRIATADAEIAGVRIPEGSRVLVAMTSANRDERMFGSDASELCPARANANRHATFGSGVHICLGNMLARAELQCVTAAVLNRMKNIRRVKAEIPVSDYGPLVFDWNYHLTRLDVRFDRRH